jgi:hypothetical protein
MSRLPSFLPAAALAAFLAARTLAANPSSPSDAKIDADGVPAESAEMVLDEEGLELGSALVIEGKVERPQVQFPLLRESPPQKEIRFEMSFLENILSLERENIPDPKSAEGSP